MKFSFDFSDFEVKTGETKITVNSKYDLEGTGGTSIYVDPFSSVRRKHRGSIDQKFESDIGIENRTELISNLRGKIITTASDGFNSDIDGNVSVKVGDLHIAVDGNVKTNIEGSSIVSVNGSPSLIVSGTTKGENRGTQVVTSVSRIKEKEKGDLSLLLRGEMMDVMKGTISEKSSGRVENSFTGTVC